MRHSASVLDAIGNTSLVQLNSVVPEGCAKIYAKLEWENPTGSMKDRMAQAMIARAEADGRLKPGDTIVEYTGGSTGMSLALVCAVKGYHLKIVTSDAFSPDKLTQMSAFGADLTIVPSKGGHTTKELILEMIETAREIADQPNTFWTDQLKNEDSIAGYAPLAEEIWEQTGGEVDAFVHSVGTGASSRGVASVLKQKNPAIQFYAVEPGESQPLAGGAIGPHEIEGVGIGYTPPLWLPELADGLLAVGSQESMEMARRLAREEGLFGGVSSGTNVAAAIEVAKQLGPDKTIVTLLVDSGLKYMSAGLYE